MLFSDTHLHDCIILNTFKTVAYIPAQARRLRLKVAPQPDRLDEGLRDIG